MQKLATERSIADDAMQEATKPLALVVFLIGLSLALVCFFLLLRNDLANQKTVFSNQVNSHNANFISVLRRYEDYLRHVEHYFKGSDFVNADEFATYTELLRAKPSFSSLALLRESKNGRFIQEYRTPQFLSGKQPILLSGDLSPPLVLQHNPTNSSENLSLHVDTANKKLLISLAGNRYNSQVGMLLLSIDLLNLYTKDLIDYKGNKPQKVLIYIDEQGFIFSSETIVGDTQTNHLDTGLASVNGRHISIEHTQFDVDVAKDRYPGAIVQHSNIMGSEITFIEFQTTHLGDYFNNLFSWFILISGLAISALIAFILNRLHIEKALIFNEVQAKTESIRANEVILEQSQKLYDRAVSGSGIGLWDWDIKEQQLYWSDEYKNIIGITDELFEPSFSNFKNRIHIKDKKYVKETLHKHLREKTPYSLEYRMLTNKGHFIWVAVVGEAIRDENDMPVSMSGTMLDISERKQYEIKLNDITQFQQLIFDSNPLSIFVKDEQFRIVSGNTKFISMYPEDQRDKIIGYTTLESYPAHEAHAFLAMDRKAFEEGYSRTTESITAPSGEGFIFDTQKIRFENSDGELFILGVSANITEREELIETLVRSNEELERFAYICSHDLQEPLRMISIFSEKLMKQGLENTETEKSLRYFQHICENAKRAQALVRDILTYSKINQDTKVKEPVDLDELVAEITRGFSTDWLEDNSSLQPIFTIGKLGMVTGIKTQFLQLFQNLINNAVKYVVKDTTPEINISAIRYEKTIEIKVVDNGIGIEPRHHAQIFEIFKRLHRKEQYSGTGIGLSICKKVVERHDGSLKLDSVLNQGCTFTITLPL